MSKGEQGIQGVPGTQGEQGDPGRINHFNIVGYILLSVGLCLGLYFTGQHTSKQASKELAENINSLVTKSCNAERLPTSNVSKFNDLIDSIIEVRTDTRDQAIKDKKLAIIRKDVVSQKQFTSIIKINNDAIARYKSNIIVPKTKAECAIPLIPYEK